MATTPHPQSLEGYQQEHAIALMAMAADLEAPSDLSGALLFSREAVSSAFGVIAAAHQAMHLAAQNLEVANRALLDEQVDITRLLALSYVRGDLSLEAISTYMNAEPVVFTPQMIAEFQMLSAAAPGATKVWLDSIPEVALAAQIDLTAPSCPVLGGPDLPTIVRDFFAAQGMRVALDYGRSGRIWCRVINVADGSTIANIQHYQGNVGEYTTGQPL